MGDTVGNADILAICRVESYGVTEVFSNERLLFDWLKFFSRDNSFFIRINTHIMPRGKYLTNHEKGRIQAFRESG